MLVSTIYGYSLYWKFGSDFFYLLLSQVENNSVKFFAFRDSVDALLYLHAY